MHSASKFIPRILLSFFSSFSFDCLLTTKISVLYLVMVKQTASRMTIRKGGNDNCHPDPCLEERARAGSF
jgi:hypothetical protein